MTGLNNNKKIIAAARLSEYGEHNNDHQLQIVENFSERKYILAVKDLNKLGKTIEKAKTFKPQKFVSNTHNIINMIEEFIDNL